FYATFDPGYVLLLLAVTAVSYAGEIAVEAAPNPRRRREILATGITRVVSALIDFKYYDFFAGSLGAMLGVGGGETDSLFPRFPRLDLVLMVGLSFYTFSCASYLADVHAGKLRAERHFGYFALYVSYFPKLLAGPIERAEPFLAQVK